MKEKKNEIDTVDSSCAKELGYTVKLLSAEVIDSHILSMTDESFKSDNLSEYFIRIELGNFHGNEAVVKGVLALHGIKISKHLKKIDTNNNETLALITNEVFESNIKGAKKELTKFFSKKKEFSILKVEKIAV